MLKVISLLPFSLAVAAGPGVPAPGTLMAVMWEKCVAAEAGIYAETKESAEAIADVAESKCDDWGKRFRDALVNAKAVNGKKLTQTVVDDVVRQTRAKNRAKALQTVMDYRLKFGS
ncbi:MAG: hypothetical protein JSR79_03425 [Proteobacteria bacterium]|nr:hypothetical protein [Pseudomonadota bacterium]